MHQIKLFKAVESDIRPIEREVNDWLRDSGVRVVQVFGNLSPQSATADDVQTKIGRGYTPSDLFLAVVYEVPGD